MDNKEKQNQKYLKTQKDDSNNIIICPNKKIEDLKYQLSQNKNKIHDIKLRTLAKIDNIKKNTAEQIKNIKQNELERFLKQIIPIIDSLEDIVSLSNLLEQKDKPLIEGITLTLHSLLNILYKVGVTLEGKKNELFNPQLHDAISRESSLNIAPNHIISIKKYGLTFNQIILRKAVVVIAKK